MELLKKFLLNEIAVAPIASDNLVEKFSLLRDELKSYNKKINLTAIVSDEEIEVKHFIDSLVALKCGVKNGDSLLDVGSGGGFPALPLAIVLKDLRVAACESTAKKANFISLVKDKLGLKNLTVYPLRSEELPKEKLGSFDWVLARALAKPVPSFELMFPWARVGGNCLLYSAPDVFFDEKILMALARLGGPSSANTAENAIRPSEYFYELPDMGAKNGNGVCLTIKRKIMIAPKLKPTPSDYPRRAGLACKKPLS